MRCAVGEQSKREKERIEEATKRREVALRVLAAAAEKRQAQKRAEVARVEAEHHVRAAPLEFNEVRVRVEAADGAMMIFRLRAPISGEDLAQVSDAAKALATAAEAKALGEVEANMARLAATRKTLLERASERAEASVEKAEKHGRSEP